MNDEEITNEDYEHAKTVWKEFGIKKLGEYTSLYNKVDVLQLADVFENFRDICMENYKLDLTFISKLLERVVQLRLQEFLDSNNLMPGTQSGYRSSVS